VPVAPTGGSVPLVEKGFLAHAGKSMQTNIGMARSFLKPVKRDTPELK
jgi:hypothetical protein